MTIKILVIIALCLSIYGCNHQKQSISDLAVIFNDDFRSEFNDIEKSLAKSRTPIELASGATAQNCSSYLHELEQSTITESIINQIIHGEYLACETLSLLKSRTISDPKLKTEYSEQIASRLDLGSFPSSLYRVSRGQKITLNDLAKKNLILDDYSISYETDDWLYSIEIVASTDFNHDGLSDWVLWLYDESKTGNYHTYTTLIVLNNSDDTLLKAVPYSKWNR